MGNNLNKKIFTNIKMKFIFTIAVLSLCLASFSQAAQGNCPAASMCKGCSNDLTTCFSCYNLQGGKTPKQLSGTSCATDVANTVTDCKYYKDTITAAKIVVACSDTSIDATTCDAAVANCDQSFCFKNTSNAYVKGCAKCASGYKGNGTLTAGVGYASCVNTSIISNCSVADPTANTKCKTCANNYAVDSANDTTCTSFTTDANCRKLGGATWCKECKDGYYFEGTTCVLGGAVMLFSSTLLAAMAFFY